MGAYWIRQHSNHQFDAEWCKMESWWLAQKTSLQNFLGNFISLGFWLDLRGPGWGSEGLSVW